MGIGNGGDRWVGKWQRDLWDGLAIGNGNGAERESPGHQESGRHDNVDLGLVVACSARQFAMDHAQMRNFVPRSQLHFHFCLVRRNFQDRVVRIWQCSHFRLLLTHEELTCEFSYAGEVSVAALLTITSKQCSMRIL